MDVGWGGLPGQSPIPEAIGVASALSAPRRLAVVGVAVTRMTVLITVVVTVLVAFVLVDLAVGAAVGVGA